MQQRMLRQVGVKPREWLQFIQRAANLQKLHHKSRSSVTLLNRSELFLESQKNSSILDKSISSSLRHKDAS
jgi:hypothetical protein